MAAKTLYLKNVTVNGALSLQDGGTPPAAALTATGWTVAKIASANYSLMAVGTKRASTTFATTDALGTAAFSAGSCWRSENPFSGNFANTAWSLAFRIRAATASSQAGAVKCRIWKSTNADGTGATQLTSAALTGTTTAALSTSASASSTVTWTPGSTLVFNNEYLWVQCEWQITTASGNNNGDAIFYIENAAAITTSDFTLQDDTADVLLLHCDGANNSTLFTDASRYGHAMSVNGAAKVSTAQSKISGASGLFDGSTAYVYTPVQAEFQTNDFTIEFWAYSSVAASTTQACFGFNPGGVRRHTVLIDGASGHWKYQSSSDGAGANAVTLDIGPYTPNVWTHIAVTRQGNNWFAFQNGVFQSIVTSSMTPVNETGNLLTVGYSAGVFFNGYMDEVRLSNGARWTGSFNPPSSPYPVSVNGDGPIVAQVAVAAGSGNTGINQTDATTVLLVHCDGANNGRNFIDASSYAHVMTTYGDSVTSTAQKVFGGSSGYFDGTYGGASVDGNPTIIWTPAAPELQPNGDFTIDLWAYTIAPTAFQAAMGWWQGGPRRFMIGVRNGGGIWTFDSSTDGNAADIANQRSLGPVVGNTWTHLAVVRKGNTYYTFQNGKLIESWVSALTPVTETAWLTIGGGAGVMFQGYLDEVRMSNVARWTVDFAPPQRQYPLPETGSSNVLLLHCDGPNNSTTFLDSSGYTNSVTAGGNAKVYSPGGRFGGGCAIFDGTNSYLLVNDSPSLHFTGDFTIDCWVYLNTVAPSQEIINKRNAGNISPWMLEVGGGKYYFYMSTTGTSYTAVVEFGIAATANVWHHLAVVRLGGTVYLFVDGTLGNSFTGYGDPLMVSTDPVGIGADVVAGIPMANYLNGAIDELRISNIARWTKNFPVPRTPYPRSMPPVDDATVFLAHCDGIDNGTKFVDSSSYAQAVTTGGNAKISTAQNVFGGTSGSFDGTTSYLSVADAASLHLTDFTIEGWVYINAFGGTYHEFVSKRNSGTIAPYIIDIAPDGTVLFWSSSDGVNYDIAGGFVVGSITAGTWHHLVLSRSGNYYYFFIDGVLSSTFVATLAAMASTDPIRIGAMVPPGGTVQNYLNGYIDEFRISNIPRWGSFSLPIAPYTASSSLVAGSASVSGDGTVKTAVNITDDSTVLLVHFDGANSSTLLTDASVYHNAVTAVNNAQISTSQSKFGGASGAFDGASYVSIADSDQLRLMGDFTIEFWAYVNSFVGSAHEFIDKVNTDGYAPYMIYAYPDVWFDSSSPNGSYDIESSFDGGGSSGGSVPITAGAWHHIATCRKGNVFYFFIDGTLTGTYTNSSPLMCSTDPVYLGGDPVIASTNLLHGFLDEVRLSNVARWTSSFTPATAPYPSPYPQLSVSSASVSGTGTVVTAIINVGAGAAAGTSTVSAGATAIKSCNGTASGTSTINATGGEYFIANGSASSIGAATATGNALKPANGAAAGTSIVSASATALIPANGSAAATSIVSASGNALEPTNGSASATSTVSASGNALKIINGNAAGTSVVNAGGNALEPTQGSAASTSSCTGVLSAIAAGVGTASSIAAGNASAIALSPGAGTSTGIATVNAVGRSTAVATGSSVSASTVLGYSDAGLSVGNATATSTANAIMAAIFTAQGAASGKTIFADADAIEISAAQGSSISTSTVIATATAIRSAAGTASAIATANAAATGFNAANGAASATSLVNAIGTAIKPTNGSAASLSTVTAAATAVKSTNGAATSASTVSAFATAIKPFDGAAAGTAIVNAVATAFNLIIGSAFSSAIVNAVATAIETTIGNSSAISTASATSVVGTSSKGLAAGSSVAAAIGAPLAIAKGAASGTSVANAIGVGQSIGSAAGTTTAVAVGRTIISIQGAAAATSIAAASGTDVLAGVGLSEATSGAVSSGAVSTFTGRGLAQASSLVIAASNAIHEGIGLAEGTSHAEGRRVLVAPNPYRILHLKSEIRVVPMVEEIRLAKVAKESERISKISAEQRINKLAAENRFLNVGKFDVRLVSAGKQGD